MFILLQKLVLYSAASLFGLAALFWAWSTYTAAYAADLPPLRNGDIIFQTSLSRQSLGILLSTQSVYSHMGLIEVLPNGEKLVVEAAGPVRSTPIDAWIKRGLGNRITIKRFKNLNQDQARAIIAAAHHYDGLPYGTYFLWEKTHIYCSQLVRLAFAEGAQQEVGKMQHVKDLAINNFAARKIIAQRWKSDPLCQADGETFETCFNKIREQELVTPQSITDDGQLETVFSNYKP